MSAHTCIFAPVSIHQSLDRKTENTVNKLPYPDAPFSLLLTTMLADLESCPGFLNFFGHLGAQCSSEPHVKQAPFFLSLLKGFLPFFLKSVFYWTPGFPLGLWKLEFFCTKFATEVPSFPCPGESFALEFCSTLRWPMTSSTENSRL